MNNELVSIVMPNYNGEKYISQAIKSVIAQTYTNWELIIVDDCSNDNSLNIINKYVKIDNRVKLIQLSKNGGPAVARNMAISKATGRFIAFLDSDDLWKKNKLEFQLNYMIKENIAFSYSPYDIIDENGSKISEFTPSSKISYKQLLKTNSIGCLSAIYDCLLLGKEYMKDIRHEDYTLWLKLLKKVDYAYGTNQSLAKYRKINSSISSNKFKVIFWQWAIYRDVEKLSFFKSLYNFMFYIYYGLTKYR